MVVAKKQIWRANVRLKKRQRALHNQEMRQLAVTIKLKQSIQSITAWTARKKQKGQQIAARLKAGRQRAQERRNTANQRVMDLATAARMRDAAILRSHRRQKVAVTRPSTGRRNRLHSSWIKSFAYDNFNHVLFMTTNSGKTYEWDRIEPSLASHVIAGNASCSTNDTLRKKRWWISKNPSLGAAYWKYLSFSRNGGA